MGISVYVHIPYCIQRCHYCDFTTFEQSQIMPPKQYIDLVRREIQQRAHLIEPKLISTLYFGGGTPSLLESKFILSLINELANAGFRFDPDLEATLEINPATMDQDKLEDYLKMGINRFSVGAQSFNDQFLKACGRRHSAKDTRETLKILSDRRLNYSFDLLFALPHQTMDHLKQDLQEATQFQPPHMSLYCLTVPEGHRMS
ncbi:MAG: radical SAM protein, partial [Bdellovibrionales bacterium]|nr:radical SAM protein [Bdellovibrionales bacterium]